MDAGYFFSVVKDRGKSLKLITNPVMVMKTSSDECYSNDNNIVGPSKPADYLPNKKIVMYSIKLGSSVPLDKVFHIIFRNSSNRMSKNHWIRISGQFYLI